MPADYGVRGHLLRVKVWFAWAVCPAWRNGAPAQTLAALRLRRELLRWQRCGIGCVRLACRRRGVDGGCGILFGSSIACGAASFACGAVVRESSHFLASLLKGTSWKLLPSFWPRVPVPA